MKSIGMRRLGLVSAIVLVTAVLAFEVGSIVVRSLKPATRGAEGALQLRDRAPDFSLPEVSGAQEHRLSSYKDSKPVVLIFASFS